MQQENVNKIILNHHYADYLALVKAARNGAVYGAKVRFPHALVYELHLWMHAGQRRSCTDSSLVVWSSFSVRARTLSDIFKNQHRL